MYDFAFISGVDGTLDSTDFFGGAKLESKSLFFLVGADETSVGGDAALPRRQPRQGGGGTGQLPEASR